jgi:hypothetical protein
MPDDWDEDEIYDGYDDPADCDHQFADVDILEGRGHCPFCGHTWYLTGDELRAELQIHAETSELIADEAAARDGQSVPTTKEQ